MVTENEVVPVVVRAVRGSSQRFETGSPNPTNLSIQRRPDGAPTWEVQILLAQVGAYPHDDVELTLELDGGGSLTGNVATRRIERGSDTREVIRMIIEVRGEGEPFDHFPDFLPRYAGGLTPTEPQQTSKPPAPEPPAPSAPARGAIAVARPDLVASAEA